ncbi:aminodeoxychorismate synthase component I [Actinobacillus porcinus]|uniref:aminodeoxychorismate synthase component I n=1 Tax=Actinobacillus porcinus TaxID=51048 RepID=UPI0023522E3F|nr:aminodeoxychorismate synthase component I [Actinobacillus porcinus]MCI5764511.1 aminodeoxychorismate synthase component I [Actinobacillus porcinus]MDY5421014.1 aminodeoxychorismate synthase component I [Actinobacillus porcinus]
MRLQQFIEQANAWGKSRTPFFFLIDFEQQNPVICAFAQAAASGIYFDIQGEKNASLSVAKNTALFQLNPQPLPFAIYKKGFELVQTALQKGNSYLLNLTYSTPISINYNLAQIYQSCQAKYKLLYDNKFVCFSPESFVQIRHNQILTYPMKGTIRANITNAEQLLLNSEKEQCEHYTIVDLMRNDLAMVAQNIQVRRFRYVEKVGNDEKAVLQTSSEIAGDLTENWQENIGTMLIKLLPAGSISGAPKEKTVETIQQAEGQPRGYYTGIFGIFTGDSLDSAVAIRFIEQQGAQFYFRSGGGITRHSVLEDEYLELQQKIYVPMETP